MFNIHSTELLLICIVALLVIGPERLPAAIRSVSLWVGRFRRSFFRIKAEIEREINADEIRRQLHNEAMLENIKQASDKVGQMTDDIKADLKDTARTTEQTVNRIASLDNGGNNKPRLPEPNAAKASDKATDKAAE